MKKLYFLTGLPRSGSTLLANILAQNPKFSTTPTSPLLGQLLSIRNYWDSDSTLNALVHEERNKFKDSIIKGAINYYLQNFAGEIVFDKNRGWLGNLEFISKYIDHEIKAIVTVRDLREVAASFEKLYRKTIPFKPTPLDKKNPVQSKNALGRINILFEDDDVIGSSFNSINECVMRGWRENIIFVEFNSLTKKPDEVLDGIYNFLGERSSKHDFDNVEQVTHENDEVHGYLNNSLHTIKPKVLPIESDWDKVFNNTVLQSPQWERITSISHFWRGY